MLDNEIDNKFLSLKLILSNISNTTEKILNILFDGNWDIKEKQDIVVKSVAKINNETKIISSYLQSISSSLCSIATILTCITILLASNLVFDSIKHFL